jgi:hypothetical protein
MFGVTEINAVQANNVLSLLCYFHLLQAIERNLKSLVSVAKERTRILDAVRDLKNCKLRALFLTKLSELSVFAPVKFMKYFRKTYICSHDENADASHCDCLVVAKLWSDFGTRSQIKDREHDETTNLIEHFFNKLKYSFLASRIYRRMSDFHILILSDIIPHYVRQSMLKSTGRCISLTQKRIVNRDEIVAELLSTESAITMVDEMIGVASVCSTSKDGVRYQVCLAEMRCTCYFATFKNAVCKHLEAVYWKLKYNSQVSRMIHFALIVFNELMRISVDIPAECVS